MRSTQINPNDAHPFRAGREHEGDAPLCRDCKATFTVGQHGEQRREVPLFLDESGSEHEGPCGSSLSARCFNGEAGCVTHPTREMLEAAWGRVDPEGVAALRKSAAELTSTVTRPSGSDQAGGA